MNVIQTLELDKIIERLSGYVQSSLGKKKLLEIKPLTDLKEVNRLQDETEDTISMILKWGNPPLYGINDIKLSLHRASIGGVLAPYQLLEIADSLRVSGELKDYAKESENNLVKEKIIKLYSNKRVEERITRSIISEDEIADNASSRLRSIRTSKKRKMENVKERLNNIIKSDKYDETLQDKLVTEREGRYVVPVRSEKRRNIEGIIHDQSSSGQTVYIEPRAVVELNNEIRQLELEERDEIQKILRDLTEMVNDFNEEILNNQEILVFLDVVFAKAKYGLEIKGSRPVMNDEHIIDLSMARHPLLNPEEVVPIDFRIGEGYTTLVVTGPNTGGKTVTLKTVGLLTLMAEIGLQIPADQNSKLSIFDNIYADIGDKQSIEMSLSTFSASMKNIVEIVDKADYNSLVLFDELGAGTDPTEGAALAMSILDFFTKREITTITTTHFSELKAYATNTENVMNASVEFDVKTLSPTFRLILGTPGKSNAVEISRRLGLDERILSSVSEYLSTEAINVEDMIARLEDDRLESERKLNEIEKLKIDNQKLRERLNKEIESIKIEKERVLEKAEEKASKLLSSAKNKSDEMLKLAKKSTDREVPDIDRTLNVINEEYKKEQEKYKREKNLEENENAPDSLDIGDTVYIISLKDDGEVISRPDDNGDLLVQAGILKFNVNINDVRKVYRKKESDSKTSIRNILKNKTYQSKAVIDVRGMRVHEALEEIENFIDDAILTNQSQLKIIHGKGTGALKKGIKEYLKGNRHIKDFRYGIPDEGGDGVTFIKMK